MSVDRVEEITLVICESCYELMFEDDAQEFAGMSFCWECMANLRYLERWLK